VTISCSFLDALTYGAIGFRLPYEGLVASQGGVASLSDLVVSAQSTPNMSVVVGAGSCWVPGNAESYQGIYFVVDDAASTVDIGAANTQPRIDLIVMQVTDPSVTGSGTAGAAPIDVPGTPAASPSPPAAPADSLVLAQVAVAANATSITSSDITSQTSLAVSRLALPSTIRARLVPTGVTSLATSTSVNVANLSTASGYVAGNITTSGSGITIVEPGVYLVRAAASYTASSSGGAPPAGQYHAQITYNGSGWAVGNSSSSGDAVVYVQVADAIPANAGDTLVLTLEQYSGSTVYISDASYGTYLEAVWLGPL
jgi:hypothetical protein